MFKGHGVQGMESSGKGGGGRWLKLVFPPTSYGPTHRASTPAHLLIHSLMHVAHTNTNRQLGGKFEFQLGRGGGRRAPTV